MTAREHQLFQNYFNSVSVLHTPIKSKVLQRKGNSFFKVGAASMQGWRYKMEDAEDIVLSLSNHPNNAFFAIYDGHNGIESANYLKENLNKKINELKDPHDKEGLVYCCLSTDIEIMKLGNQDEGSTAVFAIVEKCKNDGFYSMTIGNVGDSRATMCKSGKLSQISIDHKPTLKKEKNRIQGLGGKIENGRVGGHLSVSRSFGDANFKVPKDFPADQRWVIASPDIKAEKNLTHDDFVLLACDGVFEKTTTEEVLKFVREKLKFMDDPALIVSEVLDFCLQKGSYDNMSAILILLKDGNDYHQKDHEYIPGPYSIGRRSPHFADAYEENAQRAGYTLSLALAKLEGKKNMVFTPEKKIEAHNPIKHKFRTSSVPGPLSLPQKHLKSSPFTITQRKRLDVEKIKSAESKKSKPKIKRSTQNEKTSNEDSGSHEKEHERIYESRFSEEIFRPATEMYDIRRLSDDTPPIGLKFPKESKSFFFHRKEKNSEKKKSSHKKHT